MGYESQLIVVEAPHREADPDSAEYGQPTMIFKGAAFCNMIASFDLSKVGYASTLSHLFARSIETEKRRVAAEGWSYSFYDINEGDTRVTLDKYDDPVSPVPLDELVDAVRVAMKEDGPTPYRRLGPVLAMIEAFQSQVTEGRWGTEGILVLHYGH